MLARHLSFLSHPASPCPPSYQLFVPGQPALYPSPLADGAGEDVEGVGEGGRAEGKEKDGEQHKESAGACVPFEVFFGMI
jgi:hypothetical protein